MRAEDAGVESFYVGVVRCKDIQNSVEEHVSSVMTFRAGGKVEHSLAKCSRVP